MEQDGLRDGKPSHGTVSCGSMTRGICPNVCLHQGVCSHGPQTQVMRSLTAQTALGEDGSGRGCAGEEGQWELGTFTVGLEPQVTLKKTKPVEIKSKAGPGGHIESRQWGGGGGVRAGSEVPGRPLLCSECQVSRGYRRPCPHKPNTNQQN